MRPLVGVDVVDLGATRATGRSSDERFLKRVFSEQEQDRIRSAKEPDLEVWKLWSAKEAGFKVFSKHLPELPVFHHARFAVVEPAGTPIRTLAYEGEVVSVSHARYDDRLVAWAWDGSAGETLVGHDSIDGFRNRTGLSDIVGQIAERHFSAEEADAIHSLPSALVRLAARGDAARFLRVRESQLSIVCPPGHAGLRPPFLMTGSDPLESADVSLSHDGPWIAWAIRAVPDYDVWA